MSKTRYTVRVSNGDREVLVVDAIGGKAEAQEQLRRELARGTGDTARLECDGELIGLYAVSVDGYVRRSWP